MRTITISARLRTVIYFIIGILLIIIYEQTNVYEAVHRFSPLLEMTAFYAIDIPYFFLTSYVLLPFAITRPYRLIKLIMVIGIGLTLFILLQFLVLSLIYFYRTGSLKVHFHMVVALLRGIYLSLIGLAYFLSLNGLRKERLARQLAVKNLELEAANLRARVIPHFIFNNLNFFYNEADAVSQKLGKAVSAFSEVMHYTIDTRSPVTILAKEIRQLNNYITTYKIRYEDRLQLQWEVDVDEGTLRRNFPQMVLINLVENMFKHGQLYKSYAPAIVMAYGRDGHFSFSLSNKKGRARKLESLGVGMEYVRARLEENYDGRYSLAIKESDDWYDLKLNIDL